MNFSHDESSLVREIRLEAGTLHVVLMGELSVINAPILRQALFERVRQHRPDRLVLEMSQVAGMDSSIIGVLVEVRKRLGMDAAMELRHLAGPLRGLVRIMRLEALFTLVDGPESSA